MTRRFAQATLLVVAAAVAAAWFGGTAERETVFQAPGTVQMLHDEGAGVSRDLSSFRGRLLASARLWLVFRWMLAPVRLEAEAPEGHLELLLGEPDGPGASLLVNPEQLVLQVRAAAATPDTPAGAARAERRAEGGARPADGADRTASPGARPAGLSGWRLPRPQGSAFALLYRAGAYEVQVDGRPLGEALPGPAPGAPARALLRSAASVAALTCTTADGEQRRIAGERSAPFGERGLWAGLAALLGMLSMGALAGGTRSPLAWLLAAVVVLLVGQGLLLGLIAHNRERLLSVPGEVATTPWEQAGPVTVRPGEPFDLAPRRDADFELSARVRLAADSALDILLRADDSSRDRGLVLGLSTDPLLPGGLSRNLGTSFETSLAPPTWRVLAAHRAYALDVTCSGATTTVLLDGELYATLDDLDLRAGRLAFHALSGEAELQALALQPRAASHDGARLLRWCLGVGGALLVGAGLLVLLLRGAPSGALWLWPLAAVLLPGAPDDLAFGGQALAAVLLLLVLLGLLPRRRSDAAGARPADAHVGASADMPADMPADVPADVPVARSLGLRRRLLAVACGALVLVSAGWAMDEQPPQLTPALLNDLRPADVAGPPVSVAYAWARHPLLRRFNPYVRTQRFRETAARLEKPAGRLRILCLGSSSTFGYGVQAEQAFPARLEGLLAARGRDVEVLNAGVPGSTAARLLLYLQGLLLRWEPDVVIVDLGFNDHNRGAVHDEQAHYRAMTSTGIGWFQHLLDLYAARSAQAAWQEFFAAELAGRRDEELFERFNTLPARRYGDALREMVAAARAAGAEPVFVLEPPNPAEDTGLIPAFHAAMSEVAAGARVPLVDPGPVLAPQVESMYIDAVHLTPAGHERMAGLLARTLEEAGLLAR